MKLFVLIFFMISLSSCTMVAFCVAKSLETLEREQTIPEEYFEVPIYEKEFVFDTDLYFIQNTINSEPCLENVKYFNKDGQFEPRTYIYEKVYSPCKVVITQAYIKSRDSISENPFLLPSLRGYFRGLYGKKCYVNVTSIFKIRKNDEGKFIVTPDPKQLSIYHMCNPSDISNTLEEVP